MNHSENIKLVLDILKDEINGDTQSALNKMSRNYTMTWVYKKGEVLFPQSKPDFSDGMKEIYHIKNRKYEIKNIAEGENLVMVELVEIYPDPKTAEVYRTPLVIVLELTGGKIARGRHYCDPDISWMNLSAEEVEKAYQESPTKIVLD